MATGLGAFFSTLLTAASSHFVNDAALAFALRRGGGTAMAVDSTLAGDGNLIAANLAQSRGGAGGLAPLFRPAQARSGRRPMSMLAEFWELHRKPGRLTLSEYFDYNLYDHSLHDAGIGRAPSELQSLMRISLAA